MQHKALASWHEAVRLRDASPIRAILSADVSFHSPVVHSPQRGPELVARYLTSAVQVLGGPGFRYVGEWHNEDGVVLEFETMIGDVLVNGVDIISLDPAGDRITAFKVMIRPLKAIELVRTLMAERLAGAHMITCSAP